jgi:hypothetical protein
MAQYTPDGGVIPSGMPVSQRSSQDHYRLFGLYRGMIVQVIYPEDARNRSKERVEYIVRIRGQDYPNAIDATELGGIFNYKKTIRKEITESKDDKIAVQTPREKMNGEAVFVMFIEGHGDIPVIIASDQHPRHGEYKKLKKDDGLVEIEEFNGIEISVNKDSDYTIKSVGRKDDKAKILNQDSVGSQIKMFGATGDVEINTHGTEGTADLRCRFTKKDKKMEFYAQNNKVVYDENGVSIVDKNNNEFKFTSAGMSMKAVDKMSLQATGDVTMKSDAKVSVEGTGGTDVGSAASATQVKGQTVALAGGGLPVARVGDQVIGVGNLGAPVISNIVQGSPLVTSG